MTTGETLHFNDFLARIREDFAATGAASRALEARTAAVEGALLRAYDKLLAPLFLDELALLAVGGFGRRELFPYSDIDLVFLTARQSVQEAQRDVISAFLQHLWDSGLRISHSVRTVDECCEFQDHNIELSISLLDSRFLAGDRGLYAGLSMRLPRFLHGQRQPLMRSLCRLARQRHARHQGSIFQLEPNIKESPGGLRDYQVVHWLAQLRDTHSERMPRRADIPELESARSFLFAVRCFLHFQSGRDYNQLTFDAQEQISEAPCLVANNPAVWMRDYFRHAREIHRMCTRWLETTEEQASNLLVQFRDWRSRISNSDFYVSRERVYFRAPQQIEADPELALRLFQFVARHGLRLAQEAERRIADHLPRLKRFSSESRPLWPALEDIFALPHAALALRSMHETGVLPAIFPEWERIECLVVRDFYHRYTVDEHTLIALQQLGALRNADDPLEARFRDLLSEIDQPALLNFALLFHDTGKASRSGQHIAESVLLAEGAMERIQMPAESRRLVTACIERHLDLSSVMNTRDLDDAKTARFMSERIGTIENLKNVTLLTFADISAVNPEAMTPWRAEQLWRLYLVTHNELTRELGTERIRSPRTESPELAEFLEGFPTRYLRTHSEQDIRDHLRLQKRGAGRGIGIEIRKEHGTYRLTFICSDRPYLIASIAGVLASFGMHILKAEGFGNRRGTVLDNFVFSDPHRTLELNPTEMDRLRLLLERAALGKVDVEGLLQNRPKPKPPSRRARLTPSVAFESEGADSSTLIHVVAEDRPGLLYDLASTISSSGCNIELVLIDTEAHKAIDVFYVTMNGRPLAAAEEAALRLNLLNKLQSSNH